MRALLLLLFACSFTFVACADSSRNEAADTTMNPDNPDALGADGAFDGTTTGTLGADSDAFIGFDTDSDGFLTEAEYNAGVGDTNFVALDTDGDGRISRAEYDTYMGSRM